MSPTNITPTQFEVAPSTHALGADGPGTEPGESGVPMQYSFGAGETHPKMAIAQDFLRGISEKIDRAQSDLEYGQALDRAADASLVEYLTDDAEPPHVDSFESITLGEDVGTSTFSPFEATFMMGVCADVSDRRAHARMKRHESLWARASLGDAEAAYAYGRWKRSSQQPDDAEPWMTRAAVDGHADAAAYVGHGFERRRDPGGAMLWYLRSAGAGSELGAIALARIRYESGDKVRAVKILTDVLEFDSRAIYDLLGLLACAGGVDETRAIEDPTDPFSAYVSTERRSSVEELLTRLLDGLNKIPPILHGERFDVAPCLRPAPLVADRSMPRSAPKTQHCSERHRFEIPFIIPSVRESEVPNTSAKGSPPTNIRTHRMMDEVAALERWLPSTDPHPDALIEPTDPQQHPRSDQEALSCP